MASEQTSLLKLLARMGIIALGVLLAANIVDGIYYESNVTLLIVVLLLVVFNTFLKPLLMLFALPFIVLTFGLGIFVINAALLGLVAWIVDDFYIAGFGSALLGAIIISLTSFMANILLGKNDVNVRVQSRGRKRKKHHRRDDDDVIDI